VTQAVAAAACNLHADIDKFLHVPHFTARQDAHAADQSMWLC